jgi:hypothetical protein
VRYDRVWGGVSWCCAQAASAREEQLQAKRRGVASTHSLAHVTHRQQKED